MAEFTIRDHDRKDTSSLVDALNDAYSQAKLSQPVPGQLFNESFRKRSHVHWGHQHAIKVECIFPKSFDQYEMTPSNAEYLSSRHFEYQYQNWFADKNMAPKVLSVHNYLYNLFGHPISVRASIMSSFSRTVHELLQVPEQGELVKHIFTSALPELIAFLGNHNVCHGDFTLCHIGLLETPYQTLMQMIHFKSMLPIAFVEIDIFRLVESLYQLRHDKSIVYDLSFIAKHFSASVLPLLNRDTVAWQFFNEMASVGFELANIDEHMDYFNRFVWRPIQQKAQQTVYQYLNQANVAQQEAPEGVEAKTPIELVNLYTTHGFEWKPTFKTVESRIRNVMLLSSSVQADVDLRFSTVDDEVPIMTSYLDAMEDVRVILNLHSPQSDLVNDLQNDVRSFTMRMGDGQRAEVRLIIPKNKTLFTPEDDDDLRALFAQWRYQAWFAEQGLSLPVEWVKSLRYDIMERNSMVPIQIMVAKMQDFPTQFLKNKLYYITNPMTNPKHDPRRKTQWFKCADELNLIFSQQLVAVLLFMKENRFCHGDFSPENIVWDEKNKHLKVVHFEHSKPFADPEIDVYTLLCHMMTLFFFGRDDDKTFLNQLIVRFCQSIQETNLLEGIESRVATWVRQIAQGGGAFRIPGLSNLTFQSWKELQDQEWFLPRRERAKTIMADYFQKQFGIQAPGSSTPKSFEQQTSLYRAPGLQWNPTSRLFKERADIVQGNITQL